MPNGTAARVSLVDEALNRLLDANGPLQRAGATDEELIATADAEVAQLHAALDRARDLLVGVYRSNVFYRGDGPVTRS